MKHSGRGFMPQSSVKDFLRKIITGSERYSLISPYSSSLTCYRMGLKKYHDDEVEIGGNEQSFSQET